jgi:hypothetical protein
VAERSIAPVLKTDERMPQRISSTALPDSCEAVLPTGLPKTVENGPDLQAVVEAGPGLPDAMKRGHSCLDRAVEDRADAPE